MSDKNEENTITVLSGLSLFKYGNRGQGLARFLVHLEKSGLSLKKYLEKYLSKKRLQRLKGEITGEELREYIKWAEEVQKHPYYTKCCPIESVY